MASFKKRMKYILSYSWQMIKSALPSFFMYLCAGFIILMIAFRGEKITWSGSVITWTVVCILGAAAYNALLAWSYGGSHYEMLVSGNMKRASMDAYGNELKISTHKEAQEYRVWKGFLVGAINGLVPLITGIVFGVMFATGPDAKLNSGALVAFLLTGWSILPFYCMNAAGMHVSYFLSCLLALVPIAVNGGFYIAGAYARRNKTIRQQILADKAAEAEANRVKKINYGGLPGSKPKKKR